MSQSSTKQRKANIKKLVTKDDMVALIRAAAAAAADHQEQFAAADIEARKIVDIMESFLRKHRRVVYGGAAINAHMPPEKRFYNPSVNLPDYDFLTPDPLQDVADLIVEFRKEGFDEVEAKFGIHEGTYKIFVNFRAAADITYMPPDLYAFIEKDAKLIDKILYASPNYLRMNMYLELSRPEGMVSRWEKVYERLLLLNEVYPLQEKRCPPLTRLGVTDSDSDSEEDTAETDKQTKKETASKILYNRLVEIGMESNAVFLSGITWMMGVEPLPTETVLMVSTDPQPILVRLASMGLVPTPYEELGELLPARTEFHTTRGRLAAVVFSTTACHAYTTLSEPAGYRLGSLDFLIQMYYAMHFARLDVYVAIRLLCIIDELIAMEAERRRALAAKKEVTTEDVATEFPMECIGHQPTMPELKRAHRKRVLEKRRDLQRLMGPVSGVRITQKRQRRRRRRPVTARRQR